MTEFDTRNVVLDKQSIEIIELKQAELKLGGKGFSAALRQIVLEYPALKVGDDVRRQQAEQLSNDIHPK